MFNRKLKPDHVSYKSSNPNVKISDVSFDYPSRLLHVFGAFRGQDKLQSLDMGIWGGVRVSNFDVVVDLDEISMDKLDLVLNELELIEPAFKTHKAELRAIIQEKMSQKSIDADRKKDEKASTTAALFSLRSTPFSGHTPQENDYQKALRLYREGQHKQALETLNKFEKELELVEPRFKTTKAEFRAIIQEETSQKSMDADDEIASTMAALSSLGITLFSGHTQQENDYQKACRLHREGQYEQALDAIKKFKLEEMDNNPYPYNHEKGFSVTVGYRAYEVLADCYRHLHRYEEALKTLDNMISQLHPVLTQASVQRIVEIKKAWKIEADEYAANQTVNAAELRSRSPSR